MHESNPQLLAEDFDLCLVIPFTLPENSKERITLLVLFGTMLTNYLPTLGFIGWEETEPLIEYLNALQPTCTEIRMFIGNAGLLVDETTDQKTSAFKSHVADFFKQHLPHVNIQYDDIQVSLNYVAHPLTQADLAMEI